MTSKPRKGACGRCYQNRYHGRTRAPACECCGQGDRRTLIRKTLSEGMRTLCGNCANVAGRRALTLAELRSEVLPPGDRRGGDRRRRDRRGGERREREDYGIEDLRGGGDRRRRAA